MSPTPRAAVALVAVGLLALALPPVIAIALAILVVGATAVDMVIARRRPRVRRSITTALARGVPAALVIETLDPGSDVSSDAGTADATRHVELRQAEPPDFTITPPTGWGRLDARVIAHRRGAHQLPPVAARRHGPLGLGTCTFDAEGGGDLLVYPNVFAAQRLVIALRRGRFRDPGLRTRGPLGLGTEFESVRDYLPDDDVRQINWQATARVGRPMSNQYRIEQDRDIVCLLDAGRLMAAPVVVPPVAPTGDTEPVVSRRITRLDAAVDAVTMVALVADELGDRCGVTIYDAEIRSRLAPRRAGGKAVVRTILDAEPALVDSDHDLAFRAVGGVKRALIVVCTDLVDEAAARSLLDAVPVLARRHAVVVASVRDPDLDASLAVTPKTPRDVYAAAVALDVLGGRARVIERLRHLGATVVEAPPALLGEACVRAYLQLKSRARL